MKNVFVLFICFSISTLAIAQNSCINHFVNKYKGQEEVTHLDISGNLLSFMNHDNEQGQSFRTTLNHFEVLSVNESEIRSKDIQALRQGIRANNYEELFRVRDGKELIHVFLTENEPGIINQLIVLVEGTEKFTLVSLSGEIRYEDLKEMNFDSEAEEAFKKLPSRA